MFGVGADRGERLVAAVELDRLSERLDEQMHELRSAIRHAVFENHQVPLSEVVFVRHGGVPKTTSGKVQRRACRDAFLGRRLDVLGTPS